MQRLERSANPAFFTVPEPVVTVFELPNPASAEQDAGVVGVAGAMALQNSLLSPSALGKVRVTTVSIADTKVEGKLAQTKVRRCVPLCSSVQQRALVSCG